MKIFISIIRVIVPAILIIGCSFLVSIDILKIESYNVKAVLVIISLLLCIISAITTAAFRRAICRIVKCCNK